MNIIWFILGLLAGAAAMGLWNTKRQVWSWWQFALIGLWGALVVLAIAIPSTFSQELYPGAGRAATISALTVGGLAVIAGVLLFRWLATEKRTG